MNRTLMAAAALLVAGTPLAFAANNAFINRADLTTLHCSYLNQQFSSSGWKHYSEAAKQVAEEKAMSLCRQDRHREHLGANETHHLPTGS